MNVSMMFNLLGLKTKKSEGDLGSTQLSKINYLKSSLSDYKATKPSSKQQLSSISDEEISHVMYDEKTDDFYGILNVTSELRNLHWSIVHLSKSWKKHAYEFACWENPDRVIYNDRDYENFELTEDEVSGVLTERIIAVCSDYFEISPETNEYTLCKCVLTNKGLSDIIAIKNYIYLQYLDISRNRITSLKALGQLPFLMYLDASFNSLREVLDFKAPFNLMYANLSSNSISEIRDLSDFWSLIALDLSQNDIEVISGLTNLKFLRGLNLSHNWITKLEGLNNLEQLQCLNLYNNVISTFETGPGVGFKTNIRLKNLSLMRNLITSLEIIEGARFLQTLDLSMNRIESLTGLVRFKDLTRLTSLDLRENPIRSNVRYFVTCLNYCRNIFILDGEEITSEMKVLSKKKFEMTVFEHIQPGTQHILLNNINFPKITRSLIPYTDPPMPIVILVGPPSCLKGLIVDLCCEIYPKYVIRGVNHTTRPRSEGEMDGEQYHFVSYDTFKEMMRRGEFYSTSEYFGHLYGFAASEVNKCETSKKILLLHADLNGALLLRARGLRPTLVLTIPKSDDSHRKYLRKKYYCHSLTEGITEVSFSRTKAYNGLARLSKYSHRSVLVGVKKMLTDFVDKLQQESSVYININNPDAVIGRGFTLRNLLKNADFLGKLTMSDVDPEFIETDRHMRKLYDEILECRRSYVQMHWANPGLFTQVLFSDDIISCLEILRKVLKNCVKTYHLRSPYCTMKHHPKEHKIVKKRLESFHKMMSPQGIVDNERKNCKEHQLGFQNVEGKSYTD